MNLEQLFTETSGFWNRILPILVAHIIALIILRFIGDLRIRIPDIERLIKSEKYKRVKVILEEFNLWKSIPIIAIVALFFYLSVFETIVSIQQKVLPEPFKVVYSETDFWLEHERLCDDLIEIGSYAKLDRVEFYTIRELKEQYLSLYKSEFPELYNSYIEWISNRYGAWNHYYNFTLVFLTLLIVNLLLSIFRKRYVSRIKRSLLLILICFFSLFVTRIGIEQNVEKMLEAELRFVKLRLSLDQDKSKITNNDYQEELARELRGQYNNMRNNYYKFWLLRVLRGG
jgi:hypothetical protein